MCSGDFDLCVDFFVIGESNKFVYCVSDNVLVMCCLFGLVVMVVDGGCLVDVCWMIEDLYVCGVCCLMVEGGGIVYI